VSDTLLIGVFVLAFGFVFLVILYRWWSFVLLRRLVVQQGWQLSRAERSIGYWLGFVTPYARRIVAIDGDGWRYAATSRLTGVSVRPSSQGIRARTKRSANAVWSSQRGGSPHPVLLIPLMKGGQDPFNNPILRAFMDPGDLATEVAQFIAGDDYPAGETLMLIEHSPVADYALYASDADTANHLFDSPELGAALAKWSNQAERYARRPGILFYPGGVRLSTQRVEIRPTQVQRLVTLGEELVRVGEKIF
jgi:hypothetical protein